MTLTGTTAAGAAEHLSAAVSRALIARIARIAGEGAPRMLRSHVVSEDESEQPRDLLDRCLASTSSTSSPASWDLDEDEIPESLSSPGLALGPTFFRWEL